MSQRYQGYHPKSAPPYPQESYPGETSQCRPPDNRYANFNSRPPLQSYPCVLPRQPPPQPSPQRYLLHPNQFSPNARYRFSSPPPPPPPGMGQLQRQDCNPILSPAFPTGGFWRPLIPPLTNVQKNISGTDKDNREKPRGPDDRGTNGSHRNDKSEKENSVSLTLKEVEDSALGSVPPELAPILRELMQPLFCKLCNAYLNAPGQAQQHYTGKSHSKNVKLFLKEVRKGDKKTNEKPIQTDVQETTNESAEKYVSPPPKVKEEPEREMKPVLTDTVTKVTSSHKIVTAEEYCDLCDASFNSPKQADQHYKGKNHAKKVRLSATASIPLMCDSSIAGGEGSKYTCFVCNVHVTSHGQLASHLNGSRHKTKLRAQQKGGQAVRGRWTNKPESVTHTDTAKRGVSGSSSPAGFGVESTKSPPDWQQASPAKKFRRDFSNYRTPSGKYYCSACNVTLNAEPQFAQHVESKRHKASCSSQRNYLDYRDFT